MPNKNTTQNIDQIQNISGLLTADKVIEKLISEIKISDMEAKADIAEFGNEKH